VTDRHEPTTFIGVIRILVIDDHGIVRAGLKALIATQPDMELAGEGGDLDDAKRLTAQEQPDVLILDLSLPGGSSLPAIGDLKRISEKTRVLILTAHNQQALLRAAVDLGASGFIGKHAEPQELLSAIRSVAGGRTYVNLSSSEAELHELLGMRAPESESSALSKRESEVLRRLAEGYTMAEIAEALTVSPKTVQTYRGRIKEKLGLSSRAEFVRYAREMGLTAPDAAK